MQDEAGSEQKQVETVGTLEIIPVEICREAFVDCDVISTATMAREPYVDPDWYKDGVFHAEISFWDTPPSALTVFDRIFVDDWSQVKHHGVDVSWRAVSEGFITEDRITGELGKVVAGSMTGRENKSDKIFFNPIGMGIHDLSEAYRVYQNALAKSVGTSRKKRGTPDVDTLRQASFCSSFRIRTALTLNSGILAMGS